MANHPKAHQDGYRYTWHIALAEVWEDRQPSILVFTTKRHAYNLLREVIDNNLYEKIKIEADSVYPDLADRAYFLEGVEEALETMRKVLP